MPVPLDGARCSEAAQLLRELPRDIALVGVTLSYPVKHSLELVYDHDHPVVPRLSHIRVIRLRADSELNALGQRHLTVKGSRVALMGGERASGQGLYRDLAAIAGQSES